MSKKALRSMEEENPELKKQIGCISGFFQLFDRQRFLTNQRSTQNQNMPNQGGTSNHIKEQRNSTQKAMAKNVKFARENKKFSTESSGPSLSSSSRSRSSSMSSLEFNGTIQIEPPLTCQMKIPENSSSGAAMKQHGSQCQSLDFYDIVKDSMNKNLQGLSVKTIAKEEKKSRILKYIDSPRPMQATKSVNAGLVAWDLPRLSYDDGRNIPDTSKFATKNKELPRLSLDSRRPQKGNECSNTILKQMQEPESFRRPSSVVAKLMGLEPFSDSLQTCDTPPGISNKNISRNESFEGSSVMSDEYRRHQSSASPRTSKGSQLHATKKSESSNKASNPSLTVYGEIEKRMANLEFKNSGKDLRALQQILEAMQRYKESLDNTKDQGSNSAFENRHNSDISESSKEQSPRLRQKDLASVTVEMSNSNHGSKSSIFTMKPINVARKSNNPASTELSIHGKSTKGISSATRNVKDPIAQPFHSMDKCNKKRTSKVSQVITGEDTNSSNTTETRSPRLQKKFGLERHSSPTSPSSNSSSNRRQHNRQSMELSSPSSTPRQKFPTLHERNDNVSYQKRDFKYEVGVISPDCSSMRSMDPQSDMEDNQFDHSETSKRNFVQLKGLNQNNVAEELSKGSFLGEKIVTTEQPSPVSVLDAAFYREEPPSPVKKKSDISKDLDEALNTYDSSEENKEVLPFSSNNMKVNFNNGTGDFDLKTQKLVQVLQQIDNNDERFTKFIDNKDADHKYLPEILIKKISHPDKMQRKLMFDVINDILVEKLTLEYCSTLLCQPNQSAGKKARGQQLLDEICAEIDKLQHKSRNLSLANDDEIVTSLLCEDLPRRATIYTDCHSEIPNIVLDIERLIFKELITEVVRGEVANSSGKHCRQLHFHN